MFMHMTTDIKNKESAWQTQRHTDGMLSEKEGCVREIARQLMKPLPVRDWLVRMTGGIEGMWPQEEKRYWTSQISRCMAYMDPVMYDSRPRGTWI